MFVKAREKAALAAVLLSAMVLSNSAFAAVDVTEAIAGITDAKTAILSIFGALIALATAVFGIAMIAKFLNRKSGT